MCRPKGFQCPNSLSLEYCELHCRNHCHHQTSLISHTIFANTKLPLTTWFLAIHLITQAKTGLSALSLKRQFGVSYNTTWSMKHKIMQVMKERDDRRPLSGLVQIADAYWDGKQCGGKRGRGASHKTPLIAAVSLNEDDHPLYMNLQVAKGFTAEAVEQWASK
ncbi:Uncharacterised protein [BD1-7 clade bacterium]|uniref:ISXO2-like transposase domain-containing protein n=1 Tax=BD1-7 clade bacterium TaxID=2029982 RepID=A0A5S9PRH0_9GAMM|nr:Uncharacterised protein [BD1-7 clade bacterium]